MITAQLQNRSRPTAITFAATAKPQPQTAKPQPTDRKFIRRNRKAAAANFKNRPTAAAKLKTGRPQPQMCGCGQAAAQVCKDDQFGDY